MTGGRDASGNAEDAVVLVVEDERPLLEAFAAFIEDSYTVRTAGSGREATAKLDRDIDVVLLDRRMEGLSGDEVLERIRERDLDCYVVMVTATEPDPDVIDMGFDEYLMKPVSRDDLLETVERMLARDAYDETVREFLRLASKRAALERGGSKVSTGDRVEALDERIVELRKRADTELSRFTDQDFRALLRNLDGED